MIQYKDRIRERVPTAISNGTVGTVAEAPQGVSRRGLVRWDYFPDNLYGFYEENVEKVGD